jgi:hypothetical protein
LPELISEKYNLLNYNFLSLLKNGYLIDFENIQKLFNSYMEKNGEFLRKLKIKMFKK